MTDVLRRGAGVRTQTHRGETGEGPGGRQPNAKQRGSGSRPADTRSRLSGPQGCETVNFPVAHAPLARRWRLFGGLNTWHKGRSRQRPGFLLRQNCARCGPRARVFFTLSSVAFGPKRSLSVAVLQAPVQARGPVAQRTRQTHRCLPGVHSGQETDSHRRERPHSGRRAVRGQRERGGTGSAGGPAFRGEDQRAPRGPLGCRSKGEGGCVCSRPTVWAALLTGLFIYLFFLVIFCIFLRNSTARQAIIIF